MQQLNSYRNGENIQRRAADLDTSVGSKMRFTVQTYEGAPPGTAGSSTGSASRPLPIKSRSAYCRPRRRSVDVNLVEVNPRRQSFDVRLLQDERRHFLARNDDGSSDDEVTAATTRTAGGSSTPPKVHFTGSDDISLNAPGTAADVLATIADDAAVDQEKAYIPEATIETLSELAVGARQLASARLSAGTVLARRRRRLVDRDGACNISTYNVMKRKRKYLVDIFTTLLDMRWRYNLILFAVAFVGSWVFFAVFWFVIAVAHSDTAHPPEEHGDGWQPCVAHVYDFQSALLFSLETQTTIGYGFRYLETICPEVFVVVMIQSCVGMFIQSLMTGLIFAKLSRPKRRAHTIIFSRRAVVCERDFHYYLLFRVGDMRKSHVIGASVRALMVRDRQTKEGETIPMCQYPLTLETETCNSENYLFLVWPTTVLHKIDSSSPLWNVSAKDLLTQHFEIIIILEGVVESTGMTTQIRTSYVPTDILWAHRLAPLLTYQKNNGEYRIDYSQFHAVVPISAMPDISASDREATRIAAHRLSQRGSTTAADDEQPTEDPLHLVYLSMPLKRSRTMFDRNPRKQSRLRWMSRKRRGSSHVIVRSLPR